MKLLKNKKVIKKKKKREKQQMKTAGNEVIQKVQINRRVQIEEIQLKEEESQ